MAILDLIVGGFVGTIVMIMNFIRLYDEPHVKRLEYDHLMAWGRK